MKRYIYFTLFISLLLTATPGILFSQNSLVENNRDRADSYHESLLVNTDRDLYITGEVIWLKVYKLNALSGTPSDVSKIVYLELIDNSGNPVDQIKIWVDGNSGSSGLRLADTLSSGNYLIRAYTRWMLNFPEEQFFYKTLVIVNPFKNLQQLIPPPGKPSQISEFNPIIATQEADRIVKKESRATIKVDPIKKEFRSREKVRLDISITDSRGKPADGDFSVSVTKPSLLNMQRMSIYRRFEKPALVPAANSILLSSGNEDKSDSARMSPADIPVFLPEIEGPLLSGTIKNKTTGEPFRNIDISLSLVGKKARCQFVRTNDKGEFNFVLREQYGLSEIVIQPLSPDMPASYVELNQPFYNTYSDIKPETIYLDSTKKEILNKIVISTQVNNIYEPLRINKTAGLDRYASNDFFGKPDRRINMSDYIELKNVKEIVKEIIPEMEVVKKNRKFSFRIINNYPFPPFESQALILVDGIPVYDIENLLYVPCKELERIDLINRRYFFSDYVFDGIVSFVTKKGDLSSFESENSAYRQVFEGYKPEYNFLNVDYGVDSLKKSHVPDFRNTLCWQPQVKTDKDGRASVEFYTSDESGQYVIIIEGITSSGNAAFFTMPLYVR